MAAPSKSSLESQLRQFGNPVCQQDLVLLLAAVLPIHSNGVPISAYAAEAFHRPDGRDARRQEDTRDETGRERRDEDITKSRETWRGKDLTNRPKQEFRDASDLAAKLDAQKQQDAWKTAQADHAWERHGESEFKKIGINDARQLQQYAETVRAHPDVSRQLGNGRVAYGKVFETGNKKGVIVIDNAGDRTGGTIMTNKDVLKKMGELK